MAIGENCIMSMWRLNTAAISIEKLLDDILKEIRNENIDKIQFSYANKCDNLIFNMSYLSTIVHPLIIIRLLEHRLFTPLLKKTTNTRATPSVSLSMSAACSNAIAPFTSPSNSQTINNNNAGSFLKTSLGGDPLPSLSSGGPGIYQKKSLQCGPSSSAMFASTQKRKCSEGYYNINPSEFDHDRNPTHRKHSQASIFHFRSVNIR